MENSNTIPNNKDFQKILLPKGFAGTGPNGSFFETPEWVDKSKAPGLTSQKDAAKPAGWMGYWFNWFTGKFLFLSPNLVFFSIALFDHFVFPYDFKSATNFENLDWVKFRFSVNIGLVFGYYSFWHSVLYIFGWSERPFHPNRQYRLSKVAHNMWYTFLGVVQFTIWEVIYMYCCATKRIRYLSNQQVTSSYWNLVMFCLIAFWVPLYKDFHFYFTHRFTHIKALYKYIHAVHHRNTDIEPFAGLSMHPCEHLYYYSCVGPSFLAFTSPLAFTWCFMHLVISPAASHSGWEDHFQSDQFHYLHHRFFECNYGNSRIPLDKMFGTFRDKLKETGTTYSGGSEEAIDAKSAAIHDSKATLKGFPDLGFCIYMGLNGAIWISIWFAIQKQYGIHEWNPHFLAFLVSFGPVIIAQIMANLTETSKRSILYPFHKDGWKTMSSHLIISFLICIGPIYVTIHTLLSNPGDSLYFWIRN